MRVVIEWSPRTREDIERWIRSLPGEDPNRRTLADWLLVELSQRLLAAGGRPANAISIAGWDPPRYWWEPEPDLWLQISVRDEPWSVGSLLRGRMREVKVWRLLRSHLDE